MLNSKVRTYAIEKGADDLGSSSERPLPDDFNGVLQERGSPGSITPEEKSGKGKDHSRPTQGGNQSSVGGRTPRRKQAKILVM